VQVNEKDVFKSEYSEYYFNNISPIGLEAQEMLLNWEAKDPPTIELWTMMNQWVFDGFGQTYKTLGIEFDLFQYESQVYEIGKNIILEGYDKGLFDKEENGAISVDLKEKFNLNEGKKILLRGNGTSVYMTQDVGVAVTRITNFNPDKMIYVVASEQDRHFKILFAIVGHLLPEKSNICYHLSYGMVYLPTGKMKSREGTVIDADMLIEELQATALKMTRENWPHLSEEELTHRSLVIGLAALKFFFLSYTPDSPITYDKNKSLQGKEEEKEEEVKVVVTGEEENMTDDTKKKRKKKNSRFSRQNRTLLTLHLCKNKKHFKKSKCRFKRYCI